MDITEMIMKRKIPLQVFLKNYIFDYRTSKVETLQDPNEAARIYVGDYSNLALHD